MNERVGKTRRKSAKPRDPSKSVERWYRNQLRSLVRAMAKEVEEQVVPVIKQEKADYRIKDAAPGYTTDAWADRIIAALSDVADRWVRGFAEQYERMAQRTVSLAESETTQAFLNNVNEAVGVDMSAMLQQEGLQDYVEAATKQNAQLIRSVPERFFAGIETAVLGGVRGGDAPTKIAKRIREQAKVSQNKADLIARDQTSKLTSEIMERRQRQSGIKYFRWVTSRDERVGDDHRRAAQRDVGYGPGVYRWDRPPPEGVPGNSTRPNCRCNAVPVFEWELPKKAK